MKKYTWNEIYAAAEGCGCGESGLRAKDNARENVRCLALERGEADLEEAECPEDEGDITVINTAFYLMWTAI